MNMMLSIVMFVFFVTDSQAFDREISPSVSMSALVDRSHDYGSVHFVNHTDKPVVCDSTYVSISAIRSEFDEKAFSVDVSFAPVFLKAHQVKMLSGVGVEELKTLQSSDPSFRISLMVPHLVGCRTAEFFDYCEYSDKSDAEKETLTVLSNAFGLKRCADWQSDSIEKIKLTNSGISDLTVMQYFRNLRVLRIGSNPISSVDPLLGLPYLEKVCVQDAPVSVLPGYEAVFNSKCK
jgi:hypothetical protein